MAPEVSIVSASRRKCPYLPDWDPRPGRAPPPPTAMPPTSALRGRCVWIHGSTCTCPLDRIARHHRVSITLGPQAKPMCRPKPREHVRCPGPPRPDGRIHHDTMKFPFPGFRSLFHRALDPHSEGGPSPGQPRIHSPRQLHLTLGQRNDSAGAADLIPERNPHDACAAGPTSLRASC